MFCAIRTPPFPLKNTNGKYTLQTDAMCTHIIWKGFQENKIAGLWIELEQLSCRMAEHQWFPSRKRLPICATTAGGSGMERERKAWLRFEHKSPSPGTAFLCHKLHILHRIWSLSRLRCFSLAPSLCWSSAAGEQLWNPGCWIVWGSLSEMLSGEMVFRVFPTPEINFPLPVSR